MTGNVYSSPPIPPDPAHTTYVDAGAIRIGVEYRLLDEEQLAANYEGEQMDEIQNALDGAAVQDNGVSLHVVGSEDGHEYLRFDLFEQEPHYHYIDKLGESQTIIDFDRVAHGPMLPWALAQIRERLEPMLEHAGGRALASALDSSRVASALVEVERLAREAMAALTGGKSR
jgi:hypothetical protein